LHDFENGFASQDVLRVATALIPILSVAPMQGCPAQQSQYCSGRVKDSSDLEMSILSQCYR
jgi:hypothetical protein